MGKCDSPTECSPPGQPSRNHGNIDMLHLERLREGVNAALLIAPHTNKLAKELSRNVTDAVNDAPLKRSIAVSLLTNGVSVNINKHAGTHMVCLFMDVFH